MAAEPAVIIEALRMVARREFPHAGWEPPDWAEWLGLFESEHWFDEFSALVFCKVVLPGRSPRDLKTMAETTCTRNGNRITLQTKPLSDLWAEVSKRFRVEALPELIESSVKNGLGEMLASCADAMFLVRVLFPSVILLDATPSSLLAGARNGEVESLAKLLKLEPRLLRDPAISNQFISLMRSGNRQTTAILSKAVEQGLPIVTEYACSVALMATLRIAIQKLAEPIADFERQVEEVGGEALQLLERFRGWIRSVLGVAGSPSLATMASLDYDDLYRLLGAAHADQAGRSAEGESTVAPGVPDDPAAFKKAVQRKAEKLRPILGTILDEAVSRLKARR